MTIFQRCVGLAIVLSASCGGAQITTKSAVSIICKPPMAKILKMVRPTIPADPKGAAMFGTVAVKVEVDKSGKPSNVKVLKGEPMLAEAVVKAVKQWRWKPLELNGELVEMDTIVTVNFEPR